VRRLAAVATALAVAVVAIAASTRDGTAPASAAAIGLPEPLAPAAVGDVRLVRETAAERAFGQSIAAGGRVFSLRQRDVVQGSLQVTALAADIDTRSPRVRDQIGSGFAGGRFRPARIGEEKVYRLDLPEQTLLLSFPRDGHSYYLLVARAAYSGADRLFASVLAFSRGEAPGADTDTVPVPDPRRGSAE
jgi:hypothetical protein